MCCILNQLDYLNLGFNPNIRDGARSLFQCLKLKFITEFFIGEATHRISDAVEEEPLFKRKRRRSIVSVCIIIYTACMSGYQLTVVQ